MAFDNTWDQEDAWWRENYGGRPYATGRSYEEFRPAYRYGYESGRHHMGRNWNEVEADLRVRRLLGGRRPFIRWQPARRPSDGGNGRRGR